MKLTNAGGIMTNNTIEDEIDQIRLRIYEKTKHMTPEQRAERTNRIAEAAAKKFGFKIYSSVEEARADKARQLAGAVK